MLRIQVIAYYLDDLLIFFVQLPKTKDFLTPKTKGYSILKLKDGHARAWRLIVFRPLITQLN